MGTIKQIDSACAVGFTGHRPERLPGQGNPDMPETQKLITALQDWIEKAILRGKITFVNGLMAGWDILAAEQIIALKKRHSHIQLVSIAPYSKNFFGREKCWTPEWKNRAKEVCRQQEFGIKIAEHYRTGIYFERNRTLVDCSSELLCYWDGGKGGTQYTVQYARSLGLEVHNLFS